MSIYDKFMLLIITIINDYFIFILIGGILLWLFMTIKIYDHLTYLQQIKVNNYIERSIICERKRTIKKIKRRRLANKKH